MKIAFKLLSDLPMQMQMTILMLLLMMASSILLAKENDGLGQARVCLIATQTEKGRTINPKVEQSSGYKNVDLFALKLVRVFRIQLEKGQTIPRQTGYVVVDAFDDGSFAMSLIHYNGNLLKGCNDPTVLSNGLAYPAD